MSQLTSKEFLSLLDAAAPNDFEMVDVGLKVPVPMRGASVSEYVRYIVRRFPAVKAQFTMGPRIAQQMMEAQEKAKKLAEEGGRDFNEAAWLESYVPNVDGMNVLDARIDSGIEADAAFIAIATGSPGDRAVEQKLAAAPYAIFSKLLDNAQRKTWGEDQESFFGEVMQFVIGRHVTKTETNSAADASETASS